ncbi:enoyl-CoA hydratase-related protein [Jiulongibacter sediminis]|jgi:enoyl-CoA hydratase/carnithine racemase|uniref:enoyl-CoA hydratase-related protein n=1 Tax=Jiulongibacter sediminis TaxID=1605367 RepID=UPI0026EE058E|nr:enoyl-CoA hydratase-related protein [Jiulongibacter sediminis]
MSAVLYEQIDENIALVRLNRPEAYNAINGEVTEQMAEIVSKTEADPKIRAVILTGNGEKAFCAGVDLKLISAGKGELLQSDQYGFAGFVYAKRNKPWIAAVNGFALAGGMELCLACDLILASAGSKFGLPEVTRGLIAGAGGLFRLPKVLPSRIATELILTGRQLTAEEALSFGMINKLTSKEELIEEAIKLAKTIASNSPNSIKESLSFMRNAEGKTEDELIPVSDELFKAIQLTDDAKEGTLAFVEKRAPVWK